MAKEPNRKHRLAARKAGELDAAAFEKVANKFIDVANRENTHVMATQLHLAFLYAAARYSAHVANTVIQVEAHEPFVAEMTEKYKEMLRHHLADPATGLNDSS